MQAVKLWNTLDKGILYIIIIFIQLGLLMALTPGEKQGSYYSPVDLEVNTDRGVVYVAEFETKRIRSIDLGKAKTLATADLDLPPKAITFSNGMIYAVCSHSEGELLILDPEKLKLKARIPVGHGASDIVVSDDGKMGWVSNQYSDDISVIDLEKNKEIKRIPVLRQPRVLEISADERHLFVANFLPAGRADGDTVASAVSIIDLEVGRVIKNIELANGSNALRGISLSADGKFVFVSHNLGRFQVPTTQLEQGWMNTSALSVIDALTFNYIVTILLDDPEYGAAGSWGIDCTPGHILVAHSGTHDFSVIDYHAFIEKLMRTENKEELSYDLRFLTGLRIRYPVSGNGPRTIKAYGSSVFIANYFSDRIDRFELENLSLGPGQPIELNPDLFMDSVRLGEMYFNDASYCFQQWQSCNGCHPDHARTDGLNWDLLNDGMGNPKNCKSMLYAHITPPAMISGIRTDAEAAVRAGFRHIQFTQVEESKARAVDHYLKSLRPVPSPRLEKGNLNPLARKGEKVFKEHGCNSCHPPPYFTDMRTYEIGDPGDFDRQNTWDTPTLVEVWRTGPWLHDGRCASMQEVFSIEKHGIRKEISTDEIDALSEYVLSL